MAVIAPVQGDRERRLIYLGVCAGLRRGELIGMQGRHFRRPGWVWVSADIGKGHKERWVPVFADLEPVWAEIAESVGDDEYVIPAQRFRDPGINKQRCDYALSPASEQAVWRQVKKVVERAGIAANVTPPFPPPRLLRPHRPPCGATDRPAGDGARQPRHNGAFTWARRRLDDIALAMRGVTLGTDPEPEHTFQGREIGAAKPEEAPTGIEPVYTALQAAA